MLVTTADGRWVKGRYGPLPKTSITETMRATRARRTESSRVPRHSLSAGGWVGRSVGSEVRSACAASVLSLRTESRRETREQTACGERLVRYDYRADR